MFAGITINDHSDHRMDITIEHKKPLQNIYNTYMFADITIYGHSNHRMDILIKFLLKTAPEYIYINYLPDRLGCHVVLIEPFVKPPWSNG